MNESIVVVVKISVVVSGTALENSVVVKSGRVMITVASVRATVLEESVEVRGKLNEDENVCAAIIVKNQLNALLTDLKFE